MKREPKSFDRPRQVSSRPKARKAGATASAEIPLVVIAHGNDAEGRNAFTRLLEALAPDSRMRFIVISSGDPSLSTSRSESFASSSCRVPVKRTEADERIALAEGFVYWIPAGMRGALDRGAITVWKERARNDGKPADELFRSVADGHEGLVVGIVLSGMGSDGAQGIMALKAAGGICMAQEPRHGDAMPQAAISTGCIDFALSIERIAEELKAVTHHPFLFRSAGVEALGEQALPGFQKEADRVILESYSPPGAVVNENLEIVQFRGRIGRFLIPNPRATLNLLEMVPRELGLALRNCFHTVRRTGHAVTKDRVNPKLAGGPQWVRFHVTPLNGGAASDSHYLVLFEELQAQSEELATVNDELHHRFEEIKRSLDYVSAILQTVNIPLLVLDADLRVKLVNRAYCETFQTDKLEIEEKLLSHLGAGEWNIPALLIRLEKTLVLDAPMEPFEVTREFPGVGPRTIALNARRVRYENKGMGGILLALENVTELRRTQAQIQELASFPSENRFPILRCSRDGVILYANAACRTLLAQWRTGEGGALPSPYQDFVREAARQETSRRFEVSVGKSKFELAVVPVVGRPYINLYGFDITERTRIQQALREGEERFRLLVDSVKEYAIFRMDREGVITSWNEGAKRIKGYQAEEVIGKNFSMFFTAEEREAGAPSHALEMAAANGSFECEAWRLRKDGTRFFAHNSVTALRNALGALDGFAKVSRDITEKRLAEESLRRNKDQLELQVHKRTQEIQRANEELQHAVWQREETLAQLEKNMQQLAQSNSDLERFAYVASHDLKEPLRMVTSYVRLLQKRYFGRLDPDADQFIAFAVEGASRMYSLIDDLLSYSRLGNGSHSQAFTSVNLNTVFDTVATNLHISISEAGATLSRGNLPSVQGDEGQLGQVFQNLISNALKFRASVAATVKVEARMEGAHFVISVADNGIGIAPEYKEKIFVLFQRLHSREDYPGTGIGLAICKRIVERHGGRIWVTSTLGEGSTFYFSLPTNGDNLGRK